MISQIVDRLTREELLEVLKKALENPNNVLYESRVEYKEEVQNLKIPFEKP